MIQELYDAQLWQRSLHNDIRNTKLDLLAAEDGVSDTKAELRDAQSERRRALKGLHASVRTIYKSGAPYEVYAVFASDHKYPGRAPYDTQRQLDTYADASLRVDGLSDRLAVVVDTRDEIAADLADLRRTLRQADSLVSRLQSRIAGMLSADPAPGLPGAPPAPGSPPRGPIGGGPVTGELLMPVNGPITSRYGNRYDPYYRTWQLHAGIDIAAPTGAPVRASAAGRVVSAGRNGGYGNYVCIAHGLLKRQQLTTCYAHLSGIRVTEGTSVPSGHVIGTVGSTGASTGPHLHFEVRVGGRPTDPQLWL